MKLAPSLPSREIERAQAHNLVQQIVSNTELCAKFPQETKELERYLTGGITTARAVQIIKKMKE